MIKALVFWSGGLDSTTALVKLLREQTDWDIHVHYINNICANSRFVWEREAVNAMLPYARKIREFDITYSSHDMRTIGSHDCYLVRFVAALITRRMHTDICISGHCLEDNSPGDDSLMANADQLFDLLTRSRKPVWKYPVKNMTKADECEYLQKYLPEVLPLVHYCRRPVRGKNCGECVPCAIMKAKSPSVFKLRA